MKIFKVTLPFLLIFIFACKLEQNQPFTELNNATKFSDHLDEYFSELTKLEKFNGVVLVTKAGNTIHFEEYNIQNNPTSSLKVNIDSQFDIHSISKLMAKAAIVDLEIDGILSSHDKISKFLTDFPNGEKISLQHLMDNQSGFPRRFSNRDLNLVDLKPEELVALISKEELMFEPGSETLYSNLGYQLLYYILSKATGKPFVQYLSDRYFIPLGMKSTGAHFYFENKNIERLVKNHEDNDGTIELIPNIQPGDMNQAKLYSTVEDLMVFINLIKDEPYLSKIKNEESSRIGWSGGGDGVLSHVEYCLNGAYELAFFSNYDEIPFGDIIMTVEKIMNNEPYELPKKIQRNEIVLSEEVVKKYIGKYRVKEFNNNVFEFRLEDGLLAFYQDGKKNGMCYPESENTFFMDEESEDYFEFRLTELGGYKLIFHYKKIEMEGIKE